MPKTKHKKRNSASPANPYADAAAKTQAAHSIFKMNTDIGQHVLKNPGIAEQIVNKADLKQSDVSVLYFLSKEDRANRTGFRSSSKSVPERAT